MDKKEFTCVFQDPKTNLTTEESAKKDTYHGNCSNGNGTTAAAATTGTTAANNSDNNNDDKEMLSECSHHTGEKNVCHQKVKSKL